MDKKQVHALIDKCGLPDTCDHVDLKETHISWVILTDNYAFKIKRPVKFSFLDFSTPEKRKFFCKQELQLNKRLAPDMYISVIPVLEDMMDGEDSIGNIMDYAVKMKRMDNDKEMNVMLEQDKVQYSDIDKIAKKIADFHKSTNVIKNAFDTTGFQDNFAQILEDIDFVRENIGQEWAKKIEQCVQKSNIFLNSNQQRSFMNDRITLGLRKDCHGDLSSHNIFLYEDPVIFDCIEFNKVFRFIDVLNEIAFLGVDLDFYGKQALSNRLYTTYLEEMELDEEPKSNALYHYYKGYRASVRAKVTILHEKNSKTGRNDNNSIEDIKKYINLMASYFNEIHIH